MTGYRKGMYSRTINKMRMIGPESVDGKDPSGTKAKKIWECGIAIHGWSEEEHNGIIRMNFTIPTTRNEDHGQSLQGETQGRNNRMSQRDQDSHRDQMPWSRKQDRRQHARGNARFYQERPEDPGKERPFDRGLSQDQYDESATRQHSRGYNQ